jgi:hypothetical protein
MQIENIAADKGWSAEWPQLIGHIRYKISQTKSGSGLANGLSSRYKCSRLHHGFCNATQTSKVANLTTIHSISLPNTTFVSK